MLNGNDVRGWTGDESCKPKPDDQEPDYKHVVVIWQKTRGVALQTEQMESLPIRQNGLCLKQEKEGGECVMFHKDPETKKTVLWEGYIGGLFGKTRLRSVELNFALFFCSLFF